MALKVYNTLTRKLEMFKVKDNKVKLFVCGPTVYNYSHLGHAKTYTQFDIIVKYLRYKGYEVFYLQNITDIDDKIIKAANESGMDFKVLAEKYEAEYLFDMNALGINSVNKYAKATSYIPQIVSQVKRLIEKKYAYKISDGWYFDLAKDKDYGKLANRQTLGENDAVSRIDDNSEKKNKGDFCLWKFSKPGEPIWKTEIGAGRPGWHIEDTAITETELGQQYDVHGGGIDLIFPHHEAEIAQMESISEKIPFVKYWLHTGFINVNKEKMAKSKGNFSTIREVMKNYNKNTLRFLFLSSHYRNPIEFSVDALEGAKNSTDKVNEFFSRISNYGQNGKGFKIDKLILKCTKAFEKSMDNDFETSSALAAFFDFMREVNNGIDLAKISSSEQKEIVNFVKKLDAIFGLLRTEEKIPTEITKLVKEREYARNSKEWNKSDLLRKEIEEKGYLVKDTKTGSVVTKL